ncbi:MAG: hypothetical protein JW924_03460 [Fusobacteriaceae bacterium]|nr:hypothetical protein [Fusobacteriaceae bacterium]
MYNKDLEDLIKKLKNLYQYRNKTEEEIVEIAKAKLAQESEKERLEPIFWVGLTPEEEKKANNLYNEYLKAHDLESFSDKEDLKYLVQNIIIYEQLLEQIAKKARDSKLNISKYDIDAKNALERQIEDYKSKLGISSKKQASWQDFWLGLKKRIQLYIATHSGAFYLKCPYHDCNRMILLLRRVKDYQAFPFKMFRGTHLYNEEMLKDIESGKLTQEDVARYWSLEHTDYIKMIYEEIYLKEKAEKQKEQEEQQI